MAGDASPEVVESTDSAPETQHVEVNEGADLARLTQADVDRVVESRLARERRKFEGYDEYREKAEKYDEIQRENQTELERLQNDLAAVQQERDDLLQANAYVAARSTILQEVAKPDRRIVDPEGAVEFLLGADIDLVDWDEETGLPQNVGDAVEALVNKRSYLVSAETTRIEDADLGARGGVDSGQLTEADLKNMTPHEIVQARQEGRLNNLLAGGNN